MDAFLTLKIKVEDIADQEALSDWDGNGTEITLEEYVKEMKAFGVLEEVFNFNFDNVEIIAIEEIKQ